MLWLLACQPPAPRPPPAPETTVVRSWPDADGDGFGASDLPHDGPRVPHGHVLVAGDCDDADPGRHPGALERCDGRDEDCDGAVDAGGAFYEDRDGDGWGDPALVHGCLEDGRTAAAGDCDDLDPALHPGQLEVCGRIDEDCDELVDDEDPDVDVSGGRLFYADADGDGFGVGEPVLRCGIVDGWTPQEGDCDDADVTRHPLAWELCDGIDDDCDGFTDEEDPDLPPFASGGWAWDLDGDGDGGELVLGCEVPAEDVVLGPGDCDDLDPSRNTRDGDGDGFASCGECAPADPDRWPGAPERCDGVDDDCDRHPDLAAADGPAGCDLCPLDDPDPGRIERTSFDPCLLDPAVERRCGAHDVLIRADLPERRQELFLWLGDDADADGWLEVAAWSGYAVVSLGYDTSVDVAATCLGRPASCAGEVRRELSDGVDRTPLLEVAPPDAVEGRLETLLAALDEARPEQGWSAFRLPGGAVRWDRVVVAGWRDGAGQAAILAQEHPLAGALLLSGPQDRTLAGAPAPWMAPGATPGCALWGLYHEYETTLPNAYEQPFLALGVPREETLALTQAGYPPPPGDHLFVLDGLAHDAPSWCEPIDAVADDACLDLEVLRPVLGSLLCLLGERDRGACP